MESTRRYTVEIDDEAVLSLEFMAVVAGRSESEVIEALIEAGFTAKPTWLNEKLEPPPQYRQYLTQLSE